MPSLSRLVASSTLALTIVGSSASAASAQDVTDVTGQAVAPSTGAVQEVGDDIQPLDIDLACAGENSWYLIWTYERDGGGPGDEAHLRCGNSNWGLRHIERSHEDDWAEYADLTGANWEDLADFAIEQTLLAPSGVTYNWINDTWRLWAPMQIRDMDGNVVLEYTVRVVVGDNSENIITAFPE